MEIYKQNGRFYVRAKKSERENYISRMETEGYVIIETINAETRRKSYSFERVDKIHSDAKTEQRDDAGLSPDVEISSSLNKKVNRED